MIGLLDGWCFGWLLGYFNWFRVFWLVASNVFCVVAGNVKVFLLVTDVITLENNCLQLPDHYYNLKK